MKIFQKFVATLSIFSVLSFSLGTTAIEAKNKADFYAAQVEIMDRNLSAMIDDLSVLNPEEKVAAKNLLEMFLEGESIENPENLAAMNQLFNKITEEAPISDEEKANVKQIWGEIWSYQNRGLRKDFFTAFFYVLSDVMKTVEQNLSEISDFMEDESEARDFQVFFKHYMNMYHELLMLYGQEVFEVNIHNLPHNYDPVISLLDTVHTFIKRSQADFPEEFVQQLEKAREEYEPGTYREFLGSFQNGIGNLYNLQGSFRSLVEEIDQTPSWTDPDEDYYEEDYYEDEDYNYWDDEEENDTSNWETQYNTEDMVAPSTLREKLRAQRLKKLEDDVSTSPFPVLEIYHNAPTCEHCQKLLDWLPQLEADYPELLVKKYPIYQNDNAYNRAKKLEAEKDISVWSTPTVIFGDTVIDGFHPEKIRDAVENRLGER
jgi:glutaredoxin